jgi:hypothetical protein
VGNGEDQTRPARPLLGPRNTVLNAIKLYEESIAVEATKLDEESVIVTATTTVKRLLHKESCRELKLNR